MIDLYFWPTPNGSKIAIALEELGLEYRVRFVDITKGEQFEPDFLAISPNNKMPAIVDRAPVDGGEALPVFESGAILLYLAEKTGQLLPSDTRRRYEVIQWLMWQVAGQGPMLGQNHHFRSYAPEPIPYAVERYTREAERLYGVLDRRLEGRDFVCGSYSIADVACWPWVVPHAKQGIRLSAFPNVERWHAEMSARPGVQRGFALGEEIRRAGGKLDERSRRALFGEREG